jgi:hypothetical protein
MTWMFYSPVYVSIFDEPGYSLHQLIYLETKNSSKNKDFPMVYQAGCNFNKG